MQMSCSNFLIIFFHFFPQVAAIGNQTSNKLCLTYSLHTLGKNKNISLEPMNSWLLAGTENIVPYNKMHLGHSAKAGVDPNTTKVIRKYPDFSCV